MWETPRIQPEVVTGWQITENWWGKDREQQYKRYKQIELKHNQEKTLTSWCIHAFNFNFNDEKMKHKLNFYIYET